MTSNAGELLRATRLRHGLDQRTLARRAGTTQAQVSRIERGEVSPSTATLTRLLAVMGQDLVLGASSGPRGNQPTHRVRTDFERSTPEERFTETVTLSETLSAFAEAAPEGMMVLRPFEILAALQRHGVEFVVIGGFALGAHGAQRGTKDADIVPDPDPSNLARLAGALEELKAHVDLKDLDPDEPGIRPDPVGLGLGGNWVLETESGLLDVLQEVAGVRGYAQLRQGAVELRLAQLGAPVLCAGIDDLIAMKTAAGRPQDQIDVNDLLRARGEID